MVNIYHTCCYYDDKLKLAMVFMNHNDRQGAWSIKRNDDGKEFLIKLHEASYMRPDFMFGFEGELNDFKDREFTFRYLGDSRHEPYDNIVTLRFPLNVDLFPFLDVNSSVVAVNMCKWYTHRLDEWIQYNLKIGVDAFIIFNNDDNHAAPNNENGVYQQPLHTVTDKYPSRVALVDFPFEPLPGWLGTKTSKAAVNMQRIAQTIGLHVARDKCKYVSLLDSDEFIYVPGGNNIKNITDKYNRTLQLQSNLLITSRRDHIINNDVLTHARYIGIDRYRKILVRTTDLNRHVQFMINPHDFDDWPVDVKQITLPKQEALHYHAWINGRGGCGRGPTFDDLYDFYNNTPTPDV